MKRTKRNPEAEAMILNSQRKQTSHVLHLILSLLTAGLWLVMWILVALSNSLENAKIDRRIRKLYAEAEGNV